MAASRLPRLRRRPPLLRGRGRVHPPRRAAACARRAMQWAVVNGTQAPARRRARSTASSRTRPSIRSRSPGMPRRVLPRPEPGAARTSATLFGELEPINPAYRNRDARIALLDAQGIEGCFLFPTLGVGMEESLQARPRGAVRGVPRVQPLAGRRLGLRVPGAASSPRRTSRSSTSTRASRELEWALAHDARVIVMRAGPVATPARQPLAGRPALRPVLGARRPRPASRSPIHSGDSGYLRFAEAWGVRRRVPVVRLRPAAHVPLAERRSCDTMAALVCDGLFDRHPRLRVATIEIGQLLGARRCSRARRRPTARCRSRFAQRSGRARSGATSGCRPYYEDDLERLRDAIGADHMLFGSDFPHAEGLAEPTDFVNDLEGLLDEDDVRLVMRENAMSLLRPWRA